MSAFTGFKDYPDISTPLSADFLNALLDKMYPVGKVEVFFDNLDHSDYLGFTWERTAVGKMPVGYDPNDSDFNVIGSTGGSKTHTLTVNELASHNHMGRTYSKNYNAGQIIPGGRAYARSYVPGDDTAGVWKYSGSGNVSGAEITNMIETTDSGSGAAFNIMNPHQVFAFWKRVEASE